MKNEFLYTKFIRSVTLIFFGLVLGSSAYGQLIITPRISATTLQYDFCNPGRICPKRNYNLGLGLHTSYPLYKELSVTGGINYYIGKISRTERLRTLEFRYFDIKLGLENKIFGDNTSVGAGFHMEVLYDINDFDNNNATRKFSHQKQYGFQFSVSHQIKKIELYFDAYFSLGDKLARPRFRVNSTKRTYYQIGIGLPLQLKQSK